MAQLSDAFIALPGGFGTLEGLAEAATWTQLNIHSKPVGVLNVNGFFDGLHQWIEHSSKHGFIRPAHRNLIILQQALRHCFSPFTAHNIARWHKACNRSKI